MSEDKFLKFNSGKRINLNQLTGGIKQQDVKNKALFNLFDADGNGIITDAELKQLKGSLFNDVGLTEESLNLKEGEKLKVGNEVELSKTEEYLFDLMLDLDTKEGSIEEFLTEIAQRNEDILQYKEEYNELGELASFTQYKDGTREIIVYYENGEIKLIKQDKYVDKQENTKNIHTGTALESVNNSFNNIRFSNKELETTIAYSDRAKIELAQFAAEHLNMTLEDAQNYIKIFENSGDLEHIGLILSDALQETFSLGGHESRQEIEDKLKNYTDKAAKLSSDIHKFVKYDPEKGFIALEGFEKAFANDFVAFSKTEYNRENAYKLQTASHRYNQINAFKSKKENLEAGINTITHLYDSEKCIRQGMNQVSVPKYTQEDVERYNLMGISIKEGQEKTSRIELVRVLTEYMDGDFNAAKEFITEMSSGIEENGGYYNNNILKNILNKVSKNTNDLYEALLDGESFETVEYRYNKAYKDFYGVENISKDAQGLLETSQAAAGTLKIGMVMLLTALSQGLAAPALTEGLTAASTGATADGVMARSVAALAKHLGPKVTQNAFKFASTLNTVAVDSGLEFLNALSSDEGLSKNKLNEIAMKSQSSAKYIFFGSYISGPIAQVVSKNIKSAGAVNKIFNNAETVTRRGVSTKTISADKFFKKMMQNNAALAKAGELGTEIGAFALLDMTVDGQNILDAFKGSGEMQLKLKVMNSVLQTLMGGRSHAKYSQAQMEAAIKKGGLENLELTEQDVSGQKIYSVALKVKDNTGKEQFIPLMNTKNSNDITVLLSEYVSKAFSDAKELPKETVRNEEIAEEVNDKTAAKPEVTEDVGTEVILKKEYTTPVTEEKSIRLEEDIMADGTITRLSIPAGEIDTRTEETAQNAVDIVPKENSVATDKEIVDLMISADASAFRSGSALDLKEILKNYPSKADLLIREYILPALKENERLYLSDIVKILEQNIDEQGNINLSGFKDGISAKETEKRQKAEARKNAINYLTENTSIDRETILDYTTYGLITDPSIQELIIFCDKNNVQNIHILLERCSKDIDDNYLPAEEIKQRVEYAKKGFENGVSLSFIKSLLGDYNRGRVEDIDIVLNQEIERVREEIRLNNEKELAINNRKLEIKNKYSSSEINQTIEKILNNGKLPENILSYIEDLLGENPTKETCEFLLDCIDNINPKEFNFGKFSDYFKSELRQANLAKCKISDAWKTEAQNCEKRVLTSEGLAELLHPEKGTPLFNQKSLEEITALAKENPLLANYIVDICVRNTEYARPFIVIELCKAAKTDPDLTFSILNMKNNDGTKRFNELFHLSSLLGRIKETPDVVRETVRLEQLGNVKMSYYNVKKGFDGTLSFLNFDDVRKEFSVRYCKYLESIKNIHGEPLYNSYYDLREGISEALIKNPDLTIYYLNKNSQDAYRAKFGGSIIKSLISMTPRLENYFRTRLENITNDRNNIETDHILDEIGPVSTENSILAEKLYLDLKWQPRDITKVIRWVNGRNSNLAEKLCSDLKMNADDVVSIIKNADLYPTDFFTEETCNILLRIRNDGADISKTLSTLFDESIPQKLPDKINILLTLQMFTPEDIQTFKKQGIDVNKKIETLQKAIDKKHPIIDVQQENARAILKVLANNGNADEIIQNLDFSAFERGGIRLQYSREEFMQKMAELTAKYQISSESPLGDVEVPTLKLTAEQEAQSQEVIHQLRSSCQTKEYTFVINGRECLVERFLKSKTNGSNDGDFAQIDGKLYYIKFPSSDKLGQSVEEVIASQLYRAAGIDAPNETYMVDKNGVVRGMASEYIPGMRDLQDKTMLFDSFAVDAWLANWDAPKNDNTQIYGDGKVIKSDVGGALHYRARGELKVDFGNIVNELVSLIENNKIYMGMTKSDLLKSIEHVENVSADAIIKIVKDSPNNDTSLINTLLKRKEFIQIFAEKLRILDETKFSNITSLIKEAKRLALVDFDNTPDIARMLGYIPTKDGFEGLLNTQDLSAQDLTPGQQAIAAEIKAEIRRFTVENRLADDVEVSDETRNFINGILQGIPEFASYFGKPQHGNGNVDANGKQISGHQYSLDIHILKVLQSSVSDPWYSKTDSEGRPILDNQSRMVLKFSALLHDIGKKYLTGRDAGHAALSAEYVYSILDRFNLPKEAKNRIINMVNHHHWLEAYCKGQISAETVATMFRTTEDFTIARIMAKADLENVREGFFTRTMMTDYPNEVFGKADAYQKFEEIMDEIQTKVDEIEKNQPIIKPSKFAEIPERVTPDGRVIPRRGFPVVQKMLDGKMETFKVLNLHDLDPETDMYPYGFGHIKLKDLRFLVHRAGDGSRTRFNTFTMLGANPQNESLQSLTLIKATEPGTYVGMDWSYVVAGNTSNIGVADYKNAGTGRLKTLEFLVDEFFGNGKKKFKPNDPSRIFFKNNFIEYFRNKGIEVDDKTYTAILKYVRNKQYIETQIKDIKIGEQVFSKEDLIQGLLFAQDMLIETKGSTEHNEETMMDCVPVATAKSAKTFEELEDDFLRISRDNTNCTIVLW